MARPITVREFCEGPLRAFLAQPSELRALGGVIELAIEGDQGGVWSVDLGSGTVSQKETPHPQCIIRARALDFLALAQGRMSVGDGLLTERLAVTGDLARLTRLFEAVASLGGGVGR